MKTKFSYDNPKLSFEEYVLRQKKHYDSEDVVKYFKDFFKFIEQFIQKDKLIFDVGCGVGFQSRMLKDYFKDNVVSFDLNGLMIEYGKKIGNISEGYVSDIYNFKYKEKADIILLLDVIEHLNNPNKALENIYRNIKDGGKLIIITPNGNRLLQLLRFIKSGNKFIDPTHVKEYKFKELIKIVRNNKFDIIKVRGSNIFPLYYISKDSGNKLMKKLKSNFILNWSFPSFWLVAEKI